MRKNNYNNCYRAVSNSLIIFTLSGLSFYSIASASTVSGGQLTINYDRDALAAAFDHNFDPDRPSFYLEEYFDSTVAASRNGGQILGDHIVPGPTEISAIGRQFTVNGVVVNNLRGRDSQPTNFTFDSADLVGTASGAIGLGGAFRYRIDVETSIDENGQEVGNRIVSGDFALEYDANRVDKLAGHSGWALFNHYGFRSDLFDLDNVETHLTAGTLTLSGDLALAIGFDHLGGEIGTIVGDFAFETAVVPLPAAVWLFSAGLVSLGLTKGCKK